ncbi:MAG: chemotaxis protein CheA [Deltaproteobacteria bacterium]|nr:chemotaxis protein CheA [Deltaproteobacteria bacterium]
MSQDFFDPEIFADFVIEAKEHLETIEPSLLELEKSPDNLGLLDAIFRPMHSLKGASGFLGLNKINGLAHKGENILDDLRKGKLRVTSEIMDVILATTDALREMIDSLEASGLEGDLDTVPLIVRIDAVQSGAPASATPEMVPAPAEEAPAVEPYTLAVTGGDHLKDFLEEAGEILANLSESLVALEKDPQASRDLINDVFRYFHNIKGNSGILGYREMNALTHEAETLLNQVRNGAMPASHEMVDLLLASVDILDTLLRNVDQATETVKPMDISEIVSQLRAFGDKGGQSGDGALPVQAKAEILSEPEPDFGDDEEIQIFEQTVSQQFDTLTLALEGLAEDSDQKELVDALHRSMVSIQNSASYMGLDEIKVYAERTAGLVDQARGAGLDFGDLLDILRQETAIMKDMVDKEIKKLKGDKVAMADKVSIEPPVKPNEAPAPSVEKKLERTESLLIAEGPSAKPGTSSPAQAKPQASSTIRVDHAKLDHLMNLIGELIINRNRFAMLARALDEGQNVASVAQHLTETTYSMARISDDLQDTIMKVRMVPVQSVFSRFPRLVRDLSRKSGKQVELITEGEETELDKSVVEVIGDPLVHLIRNSVDHGLESAEDRRAAGKSEAGRVWLKAFHKGNSVHIVVEDDGKGVDPELMRLKGVEKGLISEEEARNMDDQEAVELIFAPGFSTAQKITDISGRGVGMDVVRSNIKELKGSVAVQSTVGKGTIFTLSLPLTLAIIDALMVKVSGAIYAIPLDAVSETTKIKASKISEVNRRKATTLRGQVLGIVELSELLGLPGNNDHREVLPTVILTVNDRRLGLVVDTLLERQDVVIKSLGNYLGNLHGISGATIMGDGSVILILDPHEIYKLATSKVGSL